jgi:anti-sigma regulatory factor (Ser/Thr protein kinase)
MEAAAVARRWKEDHPIWRAIRRGESTLVATIPRDWPTHSGLRDAVGDAIDDLDVRSMLVVPIRSQQIGGVYGALSCMLDGFDERKHFSVDDLRFAEEIAIRAGLAFDHARAYERERRIAVTLQDASLPRTLPMAGDLHLSADYRPGSSEATIGGDWYDAFVLDDGRVAITIGDVLGNGLSAAVTMGKVRQAMQAVATILPEPGAMLDVADRVVRAQSDDAYATAIAGIFDPQRSTFTFASAGHPGPIVRRPTHEIEDRTNGGLLLGMRVSGSIETTSIDVEPGSTLVFFTDGLTEATRDIDEGLRRIIAAMSDPAVDRDDDPAHALVERVLAGAVATDDIAVLVAEIGPHPRLADRPRKERERSRDLHATALGMFPEPLAASDSRCTVLTVQSRLRDIAYARRAVKSLAKNADVPRDLADVLELATGELVANAVEHGSGVWIDVGLSITAGGAELIVTNDGPVFERSTAKLSEMILAERGRGLAILDALGFRVAVERDSFDRCCVTASLGRS